VKCWGDPSIRLLPSGAEPVYGLNMDGWLLHSAEEYPQWLTADEKKFMTEENANAKEGRVGGYAEAYTNKPGENWLLGLT
jgi:hypothetical protein